MIKRCRSKIPAFLQLYRHQILQVALQSPKRQIEGAFEQQYMFSLFSSTILGHGAHRCTQVKQSSTSQVPRLASFDPYSWYPAETVGASLYTVACEFSRYSARIASIT